MEIPGRIRGPSHRPRTRLRNEQAEGEARRAFRALGPNTSELQSFYANAFEWEIHVEVEDLQATLDEVESLGGKTVTPITEIPGVVTFAGFQDPQGNVVGLALP